MTSSSSNVTEPRDPGGQFSLRGSTANVSPSQGSSGHATATRPTIISSPSSDSRTSRVPK
ncbi:hypothetical protein GJR88_03552 [Dietzia sp. DQ12-45-1b]|nr:hypothetical protein GJR88_03552 [Dietzia sp. DQ12-45-1b]